MALELGIFVIFSKEKPFYEPGQLSQLYIDAKCTKMMSFYKSLRYKELSHNS